MSWDFKEVKDNTEEVSDVAENGEVAKVVVSLTPLAMMLRVDPRAHDLFIVWFTHEIKFKFNFKEATFSAEELVGNDKQTFDAQQPGFSGSKWKHSSD